MSQETLASAVGCSKQQISDLERGSIQLTVGWMRRIAAALHVSPADLLSLQDNPLHLSDAERDLIARYRAATPDQQRNVERVTEALIPYQAEGAEQAA